MSYVAVKGRRRRWLAEGYLVLEGRGAYMCAVLRCETGDDMSRNGSAQGRGQRYKKRVRYRGEGDWEARRGMEPFSCLPCGESGKKRVVVDPFMGGGQWRKLLACL